MKDDQLVRLPAEDRQALMDEERAVDVTEANHEATRVAVTEAQQFRAIVGDEIDAAKSQHEAAQKAAKMVGEGPDQQRESRARERTQVEQQHVAAAEAKGQYAESLLQLRQAQQDLRRAEVGIAQARLERAEFEALKARGMGDELEEDEFLQKENDAQSELAEARQSAAQAQGQTDASRQAWAAAQQEYQAAVRRTGATDAPIGAPPPPESLPQPAAKELPQQQKEAIEQRERRELERRERPAPIEQPLQEPPTQDVPDTQGNQDDDTTTY